ncbi:ABC transporter ATP-binding protein [Alcaligenes faecalis]|uniref:ABC transporter ATP-binding protein n=1 Tax=Alcaligenes faecalis TaxID=511 RepID=UPI001C9AA131|nr:ABC transporter ATP-binding protein [Alcaligenes faecalis]MBY6310411.1 ABC transporter ATP-binding protein [Alcaligenes faecalis]MBY6315896.1 ABC transporter ATP-binding protein [Alcaligenes faecalis]MBY6390897.1 ABC transporter ATP-binding protein [Alcaligenes faecalis]
MTELTVENIHLAYDRNPVLKGVSMSLNKGEVVSLLGASGSGKTTLLRAVAGLEQPSQGRIAINDDVLYDSQKRIDLPAEARNLGLVFQSYALWPHMTVQDNVAYPLTLRKTPKAESRQKVDAILDQLGLKGLGERYPSQLSGGQQQRVAIARALVYNPPVILLDEPLSNLDAKLREEARVFLRELIVEMGLSALMVTHDQAEAMAISDRILLLNGGEIEQQGTPQEVYSNPKTLYTAEFMGSNNRLQGKVTEQRDQQIRLSGPGWDLWGHAAAPLNAGQQATAVIRVEQVQLNAQPGPDTLQLQLSTSMYLGDKWEHVFRMSDPSAGTLRAFGPEPLPSGVHHLQLPPSKLWIYPS